MGNHTTPMISVVMPVYNAERYLREAVESILNQTFTDFEFIIIDDGSTDGSLKILREYADKDQRIRLISRENRGITPTLNEGIDLARGEYIARMDADDISLPERFERQVRFLDDHEDCGALGSAVILIDSEGWPIRPWSQKTSHEELDQVFLGTGGGAICHPAVMMRKSALQRIGGYRSELRAAQDRDLFLRLAEVTRLANLPDMLFHYRQHSRSVGYSKSQIQQNCSQRAVQEAYRRRGLPIPRQTHEQCLEQGVRISISAHHRKWAWWALTAGHVGTARKHAWRSIIRAPFVLDSWKVMYCALRGR